ncbi:FlgD immunoglobulin-like domain containing protein [Coraliomargarita parva]|uniref:FlgD immunoglobulin-like domain containing protein n=1 Tax=Coraliomargarita parva TaxID=3014050 RepID=UPI0022B5C78F|nr:FlgD immunoglobulin-like domain containing protein [Coraliomargarita parva]
MKNRLTPLLASIALCSAYFIPQSFVSAADADVTTPTSNNREIHVLPAPGQVVIDGETGDWDLSAGIWSYNDPTLVEKYSVWTHLMWDDKGIYLLGRYHDINPMQNDTRGKDFMKSWRADAMQARVILDDGTDAEHQMHINLFYSTPEQRPYMIVKHGGFKAQPPYDATGPDRPDLQEKYGSTMEAEGGKIAFKEWEDGKGYNMEAFWPWRYLRLDGTPLTAGDQFVVGIEAMWGNSDGTSGAHRLADILKNDQVNRIFFFRARNGWGRAVISAKGNLDINRQQVALQEARLKQFVNYDTEGPIEINYTLDEEKDVTIAIDNAEGQRVRNLFGQYPRKSGPQSDYWDGLDDDGKPVPPGTYTVTIVDHEPFEMELFNSLYNAATPPWKTDTSHLIWGSNHGHPMSAATRGESILLGFTGTEGASGLLSITGDGLIKWNDHYELLDVTLDDQYAYAFSRDSWIKKTAIRRYNLQTGELVLFEDAGKSPNAVLPVENEQVTDGTIAISGGKVFVFIRGNKFYRIEPATGAIEHQVEIVGLIALDDRNGVLRGLFDDGSIKELSPDGVAAKTLVQVKNLKAPARFAISQDDKRIAISDKATNQVFIYNLKGKLKQTLGTAYAAVDGKRPGGKFISTNFIHPHGLDFDTQGRLWIAEAEDTCRRVTCWSSKGQLLKQYWGAADYGAMAGFPVTNDSTRFIAHGVEFKLDPDLDIMHRPSMEKPLFFHPELGKTRGFVYKYKGHEYAVSVPGFNKQDYVIIAKRNDAGVFSTVVKIQYPVRHGNKLESGWVWTDLNENGLQDAGEVYEGFEAKRHYWSNGWMRTDLTFITPDQKLFPLKKLTKTGVPVYDFAHPEKLPYGFEPDFSANRSGTIAMDRAGNLSDGINYATVDGRTGSYPNPYGRHDAPAARRGLLIAPFRTNGVIEDVPGIDSFTAIGGDRGEWFLISMDGLYLSSILQDIKGDVTLDETLTGGESFGGFIWRDEQDRVLLQLGGSSYRIMQLHGTETIRKQTQAIEVTQAQVMEGIRLAEAKAAASPNEPEQLTIARIRKLPQSAPDPDSRSQDSIITGAPTARIQEEGDRSKWFRVSLAHDTRKLAIAWQVNDSSPWKNAEKQYTHAFIGGDAVDLKLDVPGRGSIRILGANIGGTNKVIYWQKTAPEKENPMTYVVRNNPANAQEFDVVKLLDSAKLSVSQGMLGYSVLLTVPLADLGIDPDQIPGLKGITGVIFSDPAGNNRASRLYWHDKATGMVNDVPSESKLSPDRWGPIEIAK